MKRFQIAVRRASTSGPWDVIAEGVEFEDGTAVVRYSENAMHIYGGVEQAVNSFNRVGWFRRIQWIDKG